MSVPNTTFLKIAGVACVLIGFVEIGIGAEVWAFAPGNKYGSWWAAMIVVVAGILGLIANNKVMIQVMTFFSTMASILCFSGMLVDSFGYRRVNELETCVNNDTGDFSGASGLQPEAARCAVDGGKLCGCVGDNEVCHNYDINKYRGQNCELILTTYTDLLLISAIFTTFCLAWVFLMSIMGCVTLAAIDAPAAAAPPAAAAASSYKSVGTPEPNASGNAAAPASPGAVELTGTGAAEEGPDSPL